MAAIFPIKPDATTTPAPVNVAQCQPADIIFVSGGAPTDTPQISNCAPADRAILCVKDGKCIESTPAEGVIKPRPIKDALRDVTHAVLYRHRAIDDNTAAWVCEFAKRQQKKPYDPWGEQRASAQSGCVEMLPGSVTLHGANHSLNPQKAMMIWFDDLGQGDSRDDQEDHHDKSFFCSEIIARCFEWAWIPLIDNLPPHATSLRVLAKSNKLRFIDTLITPQSA